MTVRVIHRAGLGDQAYGAVIQMEDRRARRLMLVGYVEEVKPPKKKAQGVEDGGAESRSRV